MSWNTFFNGAAAIVSEDPQPSAWIRAKGELGGYHGRGYALYMPYKTFIILTGFNEFEAKIDSRYAWAENLKLMDKVINICPYRGAIVFTKVPGEYGKGEFTFTITEPPDEEKTPET